MTKSGSKKVILGTFIGLCLVLLIGFISVVGMFFWADFQQTSALRFLKKEVSTSNAVQKYSIVRFNDDAGWAKVWLSSGSYVELMGLNKSFEKYNVWFPSQYGEYKFDCDEGGFELFSASTFLTGNSVESWGDFWEIHDEVLKKLKEYASNSEQLVFETLSAQGNRRISKCNVSPNNQIPPPPSKNEWKVWGRG